MEEKPNGACRDCRTVKALNDIKARIEAQIFELESTSTCCCSAVKTPHQGETEKSLLTAAAVSPPLAVKKQLVFPSPQSFAGTSAMRYQNSPVRGKARKQLRGFDCHECAKFYGAVFPEVAKGSKDYEKLLHGCSRHRQKFTPVKSPKGYWDPQMPTTPEIERRIALQSAMNSESY